MSSKTDYSRSTTNDVTNSSTYVESSPSISEESRDNINDKVTISKPTVDTKNIDSLDQEKSAPFTPFTPSTLETLKEEIKKKWG